jgi:hypothetical protein
MSTLLITLPAAAVVLAVAIGLALADHRQPAMLRDRHGRTLSAPGQRPRRSSGRSLRRPVATPEAVAAVPWRPPPLWRRALRVVQLAVLVTMVGIALAVTLGAAIALAGVLVRQAVA